MKTLLLPLLLLPNISFAAEPVLASASALDAIGALPALARHVESDGRPEEAIEHWRHLLQLQPASEEVEALGQSRANVFEDGELIEHVAISGSCGTSA